MIEKGLNCDLLGVGGGCIRGLLLGFVLETSHFDRGVVVVAVITGGGQSMGKGLGQGGDDRGRSS